MDPRTVGYFGWSVSYVAALSSAPIRWNYSKQRIMVSRRRPLSILLWTMDWTIYQLALTVSIVQYINKGSGSSFYDLDLLAIVHLYAILFQIIVTIFKINFFFKLEEIVAIINQYLDTVEYCLGKRSIHLLLNLALKTA